MRELESNDDLLEQTKGTRKTKWI